VKRIIADLVPLPEQEDRLTRRCKGAKAHRIRWPSGLLLA
jgi:hypothetical protein